GAHALSFAHRAATFARVEREASRCPASYLGFACFSKKLADVIPEPYVGGRAGARSFAYGGLVDFQHAVYGLPACHAGAALPYRVLALSDGLRQIVQHDI